MPWFVCQTCGDTIKKPKLQAHGYSCHSSGYDCVDCGRHFDAVSVKSHNSCVTEHDKYAKGATKPGGFAAKGFYGDGESGTASAAASAPRADATPVGLEFLATRPPWACSACNVTCTSRETLLGHASGVKHRRRANAAAKAAAAGGGGGKEEEKPEAAAAAAAPAPSPPATPAPPAAPAAAQEKKKKAPKWKKLGLAALAAAAPKKRIKVSKLQAAVLAAAGLEAGDAGAAAAALKAWAGSSKFVVEGGKVGLA